LVLQRCGSRTFEEWTDRQRYQEPRGLDIDRIRRTPRGAFNELLKGLSTSFEF